jgi:hypothetical protein
MATVKINPKNQIGKIKPMHAIGQPPTGGLGKNISGYYHYITEIGSPYSRLHDVTGVFGGGKYVDVPNIFRDFDADVDDPASYDFTFTDALITALIENGIEPYYRLGVTIENNAEIKVYRINPPKDVEKWAKICEHIVAHYNDGWANGYHMNITYWEVWNEPDDGERQSHMWNGTPEEYYRLYEAVSKRLKARFPNIKVGGYASISLALGYKEIPETRADYKQLQHYLKFFHGFWKYVKEHNCPIDFYSWHPYADTASALMQADYIHKCLVEYGYGDIECHLNEWNPFYDQRGTAHHGAEVASMMLGMQNKPQIDILMIYDARLNSGNSGVFFDPFTNKPTLHAYYSFAAFNFLYKLENQVELDCDTNGVYAVAAVKGNKGALMISNVSKMEQELHIEGINLKDARWYVIDSKRLLSWSPECKSIGNNMVILVEFEV